MARQKMVEYVWLDNNGEARSKTRVLGVNDPAPDWGFDGSSTGGASTERSDLVLRPVMQVASESLFSDEVVLCEVFNQDGTPHSSNTRVRLREACVRTEYLDPLVGFEQEYLIVRGGAPIGWPSGGYPAPQGPYYCGVGGHVHGRELSDLHLLSCLRAGLCMYGTNAEVMPGQWEFQVGTADPLKVADHLVLARWLLHRLAEQRELAVTLDPKPVRGDWNGSGLHTNVSTAPMRAAGGIAVIRGAIEVLETRHQLHIAGYGRGIERRLTGHHETCSIHEFRAGAGDRGASVRIPAHVEAAGCGYFEDRRPCANADPYVVLSLLLDAVYESYSF